MLRNKLNQGEKSETENYKTLMKRRRYTYMKTYFMFMDWMNSAQSYPTLCNPIVCNTPGFPVHHQLLLSIELMMPSNNHLLLSHPLLLLSSIFSSIRVFSNKSVLHNRWPEYWRFSFSISPSNEYSD